MMSLICQLKSIWK